MDSKMFEKAEITCEVIRNHRKSRGSIEQIRFQNSRQL